MLRRLRHFVRLVRDFVSYTVINRAWWVLPMMAVLALITISSSWAKRRRPTRSTPSSDGATMNDLPGHEWSTLPPPRSMATPRRSILPFIAPVVIVGTFWLIGWHEVAIIVAVVATVITITDRRVAEGSRAIRSGGRVIAHHVGNVLTLLLLGIVQLVIFTPVALIAKLTRSDPMDPLAGKAVESRWLARGSSKTLHQRQFAMRTTGVTQEGRSPTPDRLDGFAAWSAASRSSCWRMSRSGRSSFGSTGRTPRHSMVPSSGSTQLRKKHSPHKTDRVS